MTALASASSDYEEEHPPLKKLKTQNQVELHEIAMVCDRYSLFDRASIAVATATIKACGTMSRLTMENVINSSKLKM